MVDEVIRSRRRTIAIEVRKNASVVVRAPYHASNAVIHAFIRDKARWIEEKREIARERGGRTKRFVDGEEFYYLGAPYALHLVDDAPRPLSFDGAFLLSRKGIDDARSHFVEWYRAEARAMLPERTALHAAAAGLSYGKVAITRAESRWGSCGVKGSLNFSWRLMMTPRKVVDYIVVHEVAHLEVRNHSRRFWRRVEELFPDYRQCERWLRENEHHLTL